MKPLLSSLLLLVMLGSFAQASQKPVNIILTGKVKSFETREKPYIYYALLGKKFTIRNRIKMDATEGYIFDLSKTAYKNATSGVMVFSLDSTYDMKNPYSCVHRIDIGEIYKYASAKAMKSIRLKNDLIMTWKCEESIEDKGAGEQLSHIVGKFQQAVKDSVQTFELMRQDFSFMASSNYTDQNLMNASDGRWEYRDGENMVAIHTWYRLNKQFGTMLALPETKLYKVGNENGKIVLVAAGEKSFVRQYE